MLQPSNTFEEWLVSRSRIVLTSIFSKRINEAVHSFLITNKLVTKSFAGIDFSNMYGNIQFNLELKKIHRIVLINIRKKLPLIKLGNVSYEVPFIELHNRTATLVINFENSKAISLRVIERYLRFIGIQNYLNENRIPIRLGIVTSYINTNGVRKQFIELSIIPTISSRNSASIHMYSFIFLIPTILKIITTLHRKAFFINDNSTISTPIPTSVDPVAEAFTDWISGPL